MPRIKDVYPELKSFRNEDTLAQVRDRSIQPRTPAVGWLWKVFPHVEDLIMRRHPYQLVLVDGADQPYRMEACIVTCERQLGMTDSW